MVSKELKAAIANDSNRHRLSKKKTAAIVIGILLLSLVLSIAVIIMNNRPAATPVIHILVNDNFTMNPGTYKSFQFSMPSSASLLRLNGEYEVSGSNESHTKVYIMDDANFDNFRNGQSFSANYCSEEQTNVTITTELFQPGQYHLVFDNALSFFSTNIDADVRYFYQ